MHTNATDFTHPYSFDQIVRGQHSPDDMERLARLKYHLQSADYFAFLATVFGILEEGLTGAKENIDEEIALVRSIRKDLVYLQNEYHIQPAAIEA